MLTIKTSFVHKSTMRCHKRTIVSLSPKSDRSEKIKHMRTYKSTTLRFLVEGDVDLLCELGWGTV